MRIQWSPASIVWFTVQSSEAKVSGKTGAPVESVPGFSPSKTTALSREPEAKSAEICFCSAERIFTTKFPVFSMGSLALESFAKQNKTNGGSKETEEKLETVIPPFLFDDAYVITQTPLAQRESEVLNWSIDAGIKPPY